MGRYQRAHKYHSQLRGGYMYPIQPSSEYYFDGTVFRLRSKTAALIRKIVLVTMVLGGVAYYKVTESHNEVYAKQVNLALIKETAYTDYIKDTNPKVSDNDARKISKSIMKWAEEFKLDPSLLMSIAHVESTFDKYAISPSGAVGVLQVMPSAHIQKMINARKNLGSPELFDIDVNVYMGAWVMKDCLTRNKLVAKSLLCYNGSIGKNNGYDRAVLLAYRKVKLIADI